MKTLDNFWMTFEQLPTELRTLDQVRDFATGVCHYEKNIHDDYFENNRPDHGSAYNDGWWYAYNQDKNNNE